jgi:hypothetical protein
MTPAEVVDRAWERLVAQDMPGFAALWAPALAGAAFSAFGSGS